LKGGDGCSASCTVEYGFKCASNSTTNLTSACVESIPPELEVTKVDEDNLIYAMFSEYVYVSTNETLTVDNMIVTINGANGPYTFNYEIVP
jgi:hypothetical protein